MENELKIEELRNKKSDEKSKESDEKIKESDPG